MPTVQGLVWTCREGVTTGHRPMWTCDDGITGQRLIWTGQERLIDCGPRTGRGPMWTGHGPAWTGHMGITAGDGPIWTDDGSMRTGRGPRIGGIENDRQARSICTSCDRIRRCRGPMWTGAGMWMGLAMWTGHGAMTGSHGPMWTGTDGEMNHRQHTGRSPRNFSSWHNHTAACVSEWEVDQSWTDVDTDEGKRKVRGSVPNIFDIR